MSEEGGRFGAECPRCEAAIDGTEDACPECGLEFIDDEGGLSQEAIDAMMADVDASLPESALRGDDYMPGWIRLMVALAITVPLGPVVALIALAIVPLPAWVGAFVLGLSWLLAAYALANFAVATLIVANGLLLIGGILAASPLLILGGRSLFGTAPSEVGELGRNVFAAQEFFLGIGLLILFIGAIVRRHAVATRARSPRSR